jgi:hypothetical protein
MSSVAACKRIAAMRAEFEALMAEPGGRCGGGADGRGWTHVRG